MGSILLFIFGFFLLRRRDASVSQQLKDIDAVHREELRKIEEARLRERKEKEESERKYKEAIVLIQEKYEFDKKSLDVRKEKEIKKIVDQHGNDPKELAIQLSKATGFEVVMPEED